MGETPSLRACLGEAERQDRNRTAAVTTIEALSRAAAELSRSIAAGPLVGITGAVSGLYSDGDNHKDIVLAADRIMRAALRAAPVAAHQE